MAPLSRPSTVPPVRPVPEHRADASLSVTYQDVKSVLGVPWVGVVLQALAHYRTFFDQAWTQLRPSMAAHFTERVGTDLRLLCWQQMRDRLTIPDQATPLREKLGYAEREIEEIRALLDVFDYGNPKYFLIATVLDQAFAGEQPIGASRPDPVEELPRSPVQSVGTATMLEEHHVGADVGAVYADIKATLGLPFVNSDYKAMARWPSYLALAWEALKPNVDSEPYQQARQALQDACVLAAHEIPHRYELHRGAMGEVGLGPSQLDELVEVTRLFQWLLSGLMLNVTFFKVALHGGN